MIASRFAVFLSLFVSAAAVAQVRETITVEVVEVPVYVTASDGTPLRGLPKEAFSLSINGKPHSIDYFDVVDFAGRPAATSSAPAPAPAAAAPDMRQRRLYLLIFDLAFSKYGQIERAQRAADAAVVRSNPANDYFAVATFTHSGGVRFVIPFLNDYVVVRRAIATLKGTDVRDPLGVGLSPKKRQQWAQLEARYMGKPLALSIDSNDEEAIDKIRGGIVNQELSRQPMRDDIQEQFAGLGAAAARLASMEGQKHVVILSAGFDPALFVDRGQGYMEDPQMHGFMKQMARAFRDSGAFLDAIDLVGNSSSAEGLRRMADITGGQAVHSTNDLAVALDSLTTSQQSVYLLGFRRGDAAEGDIDVKVRNLPRGASVSFRRGFGKPAQRGDVDTLQLADIVLNDIPQNGLSMKLDVKPAAGGAEITILYRPSEVSAQLVPEKPSLEAMLYVFDEQGATALFNSKRIPFDANAPTGKVAGLREKATLPPGRYTVKALLHVAGTQSAGFAKTELVVAK